MHAQSFGWLGWAKNGEPSGTAGLAKRLEGIQIVVLPAGSAAPSVNYAGVNASGSAYRTRAYVNGTSSNSIVIPGYNNQPNVMYKTHVQSFGWEKSWKKDGQSSGTFGKAKRLEAIRIELTGTISSYYDVYYRVHAQSYGWMGWAKNGDPAGTTGHAKRLEAIQIVLRAKGTGAPGASSQPAYVGGAVPQ